MEEVIEEVTEEEVMKDVEEVMDEEVIKDSGGGG
jgi:hypothetical protein